MRGVVVAVTVLGLAGVSACGGGAPSGPPEVRLGVDVCDGCGMAIAESRYAATVVADADGGTRVLKFDDLGCLARWEANASNVQLRERWVHDRSTEAWIDAASATFAQVRDLATPMGSGIAAFKAASDADALIAERGGEKLSWNAILTQAREGSIRTQPLPRREDVP